jgi:hypothetical protein
MLDGLPRALLIVVLLASSGCAGATRGTRAKPPTPSGRLFGSATTSEQHGLLVLSNGRTGGRGQSTETWSATDDAELAVLWRDVHRPGSPPAIDFSRYVVFGAVFEGSVCPTPVLGIESEASGLLRLTYDPDRLLDNCILQAVRVAQVVAVPRRILPGRVVYLWGYRFLLER